MIACTLAKIPTSVEYNKINTRRTHDQIKNIHQFQKIYAAMIVVSKKFQQRNSK